MNAQARPKENFPSNRKRSTSSPQPSNRPHRIAVLPETTTGQRLANLFPNKWHWLYSAAPIIGIKPAWETVRRYPITPVELFSYHQDPDSIIGIRPSLSTLWGVIDIDRPSRYHPSNNPNGLQTIHNALEGIGITRTLINQSSHSGGLHIYIPLPEAINSYALSITLKYHLEGAGIQIRSGQCEIFPNPKRFIPKGEGYSQYNGIRLPMQPDSGFIPLDIDLNPLHLTLEGWLDRFDLCAAQQDIAKLTRHIEDAQLNRKTRTHRDPASIDTWRDRIEQEKIQGWTGAGQTNEKLKLFGCEARIFLGMDSVAQIAQHIQETAQNCPGFHQHSSHTQGIAQRSQEIAQWAKRFYWPFRTPRTRDIGYHTPPTPSPIASFEYHQAKREAAQHRITQAVNQLIEQNILAPTASHRAAQIIELGRISKKTLYRSINKALWHPKHLPVLEQAKQPEQPKTDTEQGCLQPTPKPTKKAQPQPPEPLPKGLCFDLLKYVGFVILNLLIEAAAALTPQKGQKAAQAALPTAETPNRGGLGGNIAHPEPSAHPAPSAPQTPIAPASKWRNLRTSLPEAFQSKIAQAELHRTRAQERETHRRERAESRQLLLSLPQIPDQNPGEISSKPTFKTPPPPHFPTPSIGPFPQIAPLQRPPTLAEQQEFETWYLLAEQFKLVTDHHWEDCEYWVESNQQWHPYCELSGTFTTRRLRQYLGKPPHCDINISNDI